MAISPEVYLISSILRDRDMVTALKAGLSRAQFHACIDEWVWIEQYYLRHRQEPSKVAFKQQFPEFGIKAVNDTAHYAEMVRKAHARSSLTTAMRDVADHLAVGDIESAVSAMHAKIIAISSEMGDGTDDSDIITSWEDTYSEVEKRFHRVRDVGLAGIPTGFLTLDERTGGPQPGHIWVAAARLGVGKGNLLTEVVPTPTGWRKWGDLRVGDEVFGSDGRPTRVTATHDNGTMPVYEITFSDDVKITVDGDHLWCVNELGGHRRTWQGDVKTRVLSTHELSQQSLRTREGWRFRIPLIDPVVYPTANLPIEPYTLGALIANGSTTGSSALIVTPDQDIVDRIRKTYSVKWDNTGWGPNKGMVCPSGVVKGLISRIRDLGLNVKSREKFIPPMYLMADIDQRIALLQGLFDGDGSSRHRDGRSSITYSTTSRQLARDITELVASLGGTATVQWRDRGDKGMEAKMNVLLPGDIPVFHTSAKPRKHFNAKSQPKRAITNIRYVGEDVTRCITVDSADSLYAVTRKYILTHNSWTLMRMATAAIMDGYTVQYNALEQTRAEVSMRIHTLLSGQVGQQLFANMDLMQGRNFDIDDYKQFLRGLRKEIGGRMHVSDTSRGKVSPLTIASQIERNKPDLVVIDYLTLMEKTEADWQGVAKLSGELKMLAMEYQVPIVVAAQLNRAHGLSRREPAGPEALAQSDAIGQDADAVVTMRQASESVLEMKLVKYRHGLSGFKWRCHFEPGLGIFKEVGYDEAEALIDSDQDDKDRG